MRYVAKPRNKIPRAFVEAATAEMNEVLPLFQRAKQKKPSYKYKAYRNAALVQVLEELFHKKCAYCESNYAATGYVEIEHYRPKSLYYWLAADWSNLLPACKRCNNGKLSKFPLVDSRMQARRKGDERRELPLLLNPSDPRKSRRPEKHLTFDADDGTIRPIVKRGQPSLIGSTSIEVYRLTRTDLSQLRKGWARRVKGHLMFCALAQRTGTAEEREAAYQGLKDLVEPTQPFSALTLHILQENGIKFPRQRRKKR